MAASAIWRLFPLCNIAALCHSRLACSNSAGGASIPLVKCTRPYGLGGAGISASWPRPGDPKSCAPRGISRGIEHSLAEIFLGIGCTASLVCFKAYHISHILQSSQRISCRGATVSSGSMHFDWRSRALVWHRLHHGHSIAKGAASTTSSRSKPQCSNRSLRSLRLPGRSYTLPCCSGIDGV
jgi:hypothetical protein